MARSPKNLAITSIESTSLIDIDYSVPKNKVTTASLVITNMTSNIIEVAVYINNTIDDYLLVKGKIPAGIGRAWRVIELLDEKLNAGFIIKTQCSTNDKHNIFLSGSEISDS